MGSSSEEYAAFREKVRRTIYVDNMSPLVTESVVKASFNQFGNVSSVQFIPTYLEPKTMARAALVEMEDSKQARDIIADMETHPLMILGMPRPVRARPAEIEMFDDRPRKPGRRIQCRWLEPKDPDFEVAQKIKQVVNRHAAEASFLLEVNLVFLSSCLSMFINWFYFYPHFFVRPTTFIFFLPIHSSEPTSYNQL